LPSISLLARDEGPVLTRRRVTVLQASARLKSCCNELGPGPTVCPYYSGYECSLGKPSITQSLTETQNISLPFSV